MNVVLISTYELGHQPFGLASPAAWLRERGHRVACADLGLCSLPNQAVREADLVAFYLPMHTATRLAARVIGKVKELNPAGLMANHPQPTVIDVHLYPCVGGSSPICPSTDAVAQVESEAEIDFSDLYHFISWPEFSFPPTTPLLLGETHSDTNNGQNVTCEGGAPLDAAAQTVTGFNVSGFPGNGYGVVFRPWMQLQAPSGICFTYPGNQTANLNGQGPYTPTQQ